MVDPIGQKPLPTSNPKIAGVTRVAATPASGSVASQDQVASSTVALSHELAASPPIDHERIARIRKAVADGTFPIVPAQIADRLIAAKLEWARHDAE